MNLRFNQGAIVEFTLKGVDNPIIGKVVNVLPDEVELYPQLLVNRESLASCTVDATTSIHLRRELIISWKYAELSSITDYGHFKETEIIPQSIINYFESNGFCKGDGCYCGNIKEESSINYDLLDDGK